MEKYKAPLDGQDRRAFEADEGGFETHGFAKGF
jgi:hypothetical protein